MDLIKIAEEAFAVPQKNRDEFGPGDTITVAYRIKEGNKERIQQCSLPAPTHWDNRRRPDEAGDKPEGPVSRQSQLSPPTSLIAEAAHPAQFSTQYNC